MKIKALKQLKYKLAQEFAYSHPLITQEEKQAMAIGFIAGFEKARGLAAQKIKNSIAPEGNKSFDDWVINQRLQAKHDHDLCLKLGEEDVQE